MMIRFTMILGIFMLLAQLDMRGQNVQLRCTEVQGNGDVILHWTTVTDPSGFVKYTIYSSTQQAGPYTQIHDEFNWQEDSYLHAGAGASFNTIYYYLVTYLTTGPPQTSDTLSTKPLSPPVSDSVSINADEKVIIGWEPGQEPNIKGYNIYRWTSNNPPIREWIDYVDGRFNTSYLHASSDPCSGPLGYTVSSVDLCDHESFVPSDPSPPFLETRYTSIYLADIAYDPCAMTNSLSWNEYENFDPPLAFTRIYMSEDNGPYQVLQTVYPGEATYLHTNLQSFTTYHYFVRAFSMDNQKSSTSCTKQVSTYNSPSPSYMYTRYVTVENNANVNILFYTDTSAHVQAYNILRSTLLSGPYETVGTVASQGEEFVSFTDVAAEVNASSYYYLIEVIDSCGIALTIANISRTILLEVEVMGNMNNHLTWNAYESWDGAVEGYRIYRRLDNNAPLELLQTVDASTLYYTDNVSSFTGNSGRINYLVEAFEGNTNQWGFKESSYSNEVLAEQESYLYMPNAIIPLGYKDARNSELKPVSVFVGGDGYEFRVYNRWGHMIFQTSDTNKGWNGTYKNGEYVEGGMYVYMISYRDANNQLKIQKGNVVVIY